VKDENKRAPTRNRAWVCHTDRAVLERAWFWTQAWFDKKDDGPTLLRSLCLVRFGHQELIMH